MSNDKEMAVPSATGEHSETLLLGSRPQRVENHAINPLLIKYSLSNDGQTLIIVWLITTPGRGEDASWTDESMHLLDLYVRGFAPVDVARVLVEKYRALPGNVGRDIFDGNPAYTDGELLGDVKLPDMDIIQEDRRIASLQLDEIARFVHVKLACRERQLLIASKENIQLRESIPSPEDFAAVVAEGGKLAEQIRAEMQAKLDELWNEAIEWKGRAETAEAALAAMTEDRNLWQHAHDEDCPNKAALERVEAELARLKGKS